MSAEFDPSCLPFTAYLALTFATSEMGLQTLFNGLKRSISGKRNNQITAFDDILTNSVYCSRRQRYPANSVVINSWNKDSTVLPVDKRDTVIDLKFLLAQQIGTKPEFIQLLVNL
eukprot:992415_1